MEISLKGKLAKIEAEIKTKQPNEIKGGKVARPSMERDKDHWVHEGYRQRVDYKSWRNILLNHEDSIIFKGKIR